MLRNGKARVAATLMTAGALGWASGSYAAATQFEGQVQAGGGPVMNSTVTLWAASAGDPKQLAQTKTDVEGHFQLGAGNITGPDVSLYVIAEGGVAALNKDGDDNPALAFLSVLGSAPPAKVVVNEMTTIASVVTHAQFIERGDQGLAARARHRRWQRAQFRRPRDRGLRGNYSRWAERRPNAIDG